MTKMAMDPAKNRNVLAVAIGVLMIMPPTAFSGDGTQWGSTPTQDYNREIPALQESVTEESGGTQPQHEVPLDTTVFFRSGPLSLSETSVEAITPGEVLSVVPAEEVYAQLELIEDPDVRAEAKAAIEDGSQFTKRVSQNQHVEYQWTSVKDPNVSYRIDTSARIDFPTGTWESGEPILRPVANFSRIEKIDVKSLQQFAQNLTDPEERAQFEAAISDTGSNDPAVATYAYPGEGRSSSRTWTWTSAVDPNKTYALSSDSWPSGIDVRGVGIETFWHFSTQTVISKEEFLDELGSLKDFSDYDFRINLGITDGCRFIKIVDKDDVIYQWASASDPNTIYQISVAKDGYGSFSKMTEIPAEEFLRLLSKDLFFRVQDEAAIAEGTQFFEITNGNNEVSYGWVSNDNPNMFYTIDMDDQDSVRTGPSMSGTGASSGLKDIVDMAELRRLVQSLAYPDAKAQRVSSREKDEYEISDILSDAVDTNIFLRSLNSRYFLPQGYLFQKNVNKVNFERYGKAHQKNLDVFFKVKTGQMLKVPTDPTNPIDPKEFIQIQCADLYLSGVLSYEQTEVIRQILLKALRGKTLSLKLTSEGVTASANLPRDDHSETANVLRAFADDMNTTPRLAGALGNKAVTAARDLADETLEQFRDSDLDRAMSVLRALKTPAEEIVPAGVKDRYKVLDGVVINQEMAVTNTLIKPSEGVHPFLRWFLNKKYVDEKRLESYEETRQKILSIYLRAKAGEGLIRYKEQVGSLYLPFLDEGGGRYELVTAGR